MKQVSTSILSKEDKFINIEKLNNSNTDYIHLDIMDGKFVNNTFITKEELPKVIESCNKKIDIHLMVENPKEYIDICKGYDISYITIHYELDNFLELVNYIKDNGFKVGVAIKPDTDIKKIYDYLDILDLVLVMSVNPGYSGQTFIDSSEDKINKLINEIEKRNYDVKISVDGGVCDSVLDKIKNTDIIVSASYVLNNLDNINKLKAV